jgi:parvulin-like peptidyl-prolyl isomerase
VLQTNAYLRKIAEPQLKGRVTDDLLHKQFDVEYGQTLRARFIQLDNLQQVAEAKQRLEKGERFEEVARRMSRDPQSAAVGGLMNDFSRGTTDLPQNFRDVAFATEVGKVSETVQANNAYFLIKPEKKFEPKAVKFESVKESLRAKAYDILMQETVAGLRRQLAADAMASLQIDEPTLKRQFDDRKNASAREQEKQAKMRKAQEERDMSVQDRIRRFRDEHPTTAPAKAPAVGASR